MINLPKRDCPEAIQSYKSYKSCKPHKNSFTGGRGTLGERLVATMDTVKHLISSSCQEKKKQQKKQKKIRSKSIDWSKRTEKYNTRIELIPYFEVINKKCLVHCKCGTQYVYVAETKLTSSLPPYLKPGSPNPRLGERHSARTRYATTSGGRHFIIP